MTTPTPAVSHSTEKHVGLLHSLTEREAALVRRLRRQTIGMSPAAEPKLTTGEHVADKVAAAVGSWTFIIIQTVILVIWMILNVTAYVEHWDPYPFILLNLALSFQAAYSAPVIMMSQNRQASIDRADARHDYDVNIRAEMEIESLHAKIDLLREQEIAQLVEVVRRLESRLDIASEQNGTTGVSPMPHHGNTVQPDR
jgi:uncharacterized membrane protein